MDKDGMLIEANELKSTFTAIITLRQHNFIYLLFLMPFLIFFKDTVK